MLQTDIKEFIQQIKELGYSVKLDTNGCFPDKLKDLVDSGLIDYVAMDIKNSPEKYLATAGISSQLVFDKVKEIISLFSLLNNSNFFSNIANNELLNKSIDIQNDSYDKLLKRIK